MTRSRKVLLAFSVVAVIALAAACSGQRILNGLVTDEGYKVRKDMAYGSDVRQKMDIYIPDRPATDGCTILFLYGGRWEGGDKALYKFVGQALSSKGCVTAIADYRVYPKVKYPAFVQDSAAAFVWLHTHVAEFGGHADKLFIAGHSAGAYNAAMVAVHPRYLSEAGGQRGWIRGVIGISGPYDFLPFTDKDIIDIFSPEKGPATQPITYAGAGMPPMLLVHGENDREVYPKNTRNFAAKLKAAGSPVETIIYPDAPHEAIVLSLLNGFRGKIPLLEDISTFVHATSK